jgi:hypothetical protein
MPLAPKIAVGVIEQNAGLQPADIDFLREAIRNALRQHAAGRYEVYLATLFPGPCDAVCQSNLVIQSGGTYYVTGEVRQFAGSYIVSLWLVRPVGGPAAPRVESEPLESAAALIAGTKQLVGKLMDGGPFPTTAPAAQPAPAPLQPAPTPQPAPPPAGWTDQPAEDQWGQPRLVMSEEDYSLLNMRIASYVVFGTGMVMNSVAGGMWIIGLSQSNMSDTAFVTAIVLTIVGPLTTIAGAIVGGNYRKRKNPDKKSYGITALVAPNFAGLGLAGSF